ncbi:hypothetical protein FW778_22635 [Ginsengibacter hankyongi]|uniref:Glycoside hydrolase 123-like N-terminal domain-containing protein n=1 Tax=Ginsengibacter hankyongi TaxID=2607284 RepID=A0A5J5IAF1_9BACT|nr:glycoside hydrolase domain-containing protein [Ginsengibacter hankyongi]KAA9034366.1 hypothetical protein FW778_22635 [Ginsengibacter hankyongi]
MCNKKNLRAAGLFILVFFLLGKRAVFAQEICYGTGKWDNKEYGNHRAVIEVPVDSDAVWVHVPWRREDNPEKKSVILVDASTGKTVENIYRVNVNTESGDFIFQPATGKGDYYLYFMPYRTSGSWYFPNTIYPGYVDHCDVTWEKKNNVLTLPDTGRLPKARVVRFESINTFNSFDPMEIVATKKTVRSFLDQNSNKEFLIFPEDRKHPIRMDTHIPERWAVENESQAFSGSALRNEFYVYQLGIFAAFKALKNVRLVFSDLTEKTGQKIPASSIRCINLQGRDWLGKAFTKEVDIKKGHVQALWIGVDIMKDVSPGLYTGTVTVLAHGIGARLIDVHISVGDGIIADRGYDELFRMARLNWLDSDIGLDDSVFKPYIPVELNRQIVKVLGRTLRFNKYGLPDKITSYFTGSNDSINGIPRDIIAAPVQLVTLQHGEKLKWKSGGPQITEKKEGAVSWRTTEERPDAQMIIRAKMECDGYINYQVDFKAREAMTVDDIQLLIPYAKPVATYMMGLGFKGGLRPERWDWRWNKERANNMVWIGDVNAGLQCKLKNEFPDWTLYNFDKTGTYKDWSNEGLGGCSLSEQGNSFLFKAFTGKKVLRAGQVLHLNFGLLITPLKLLDNNHWSERYFQSDPPVDNWLTKAVEKGANVMNIHQGNILNPYINYPFIATDTLKNFIAAARSKGIRCKIYYTVRELSNHTPELWALRSLGNEIFTPGMGSQLADQFADDGTGGNLYSTGGSWLTEHLRTNYDAAWHSPVQGGGWDMAIRTQGLSRWHNYYLEGLRWLVKNVGIRGIYLDGVGYDREIMKRVRKVLDRSADSCLIDFHSGNNFQPAYGLNSTANEYMELFPCINSLWLGEMFNYNENPDYWLVEMSGIPFGLYGEMLNGCGNAWRGMVYGVTSRLGWGGCDPSALWQLWDQFGIKKAKMIGYWDPFLPVKCNSKEVKVTVYRRSDKILIAYASWATQDIHIKLDINWKSVNLNATQVGIRAPSIRDFQEAHFYNNLDDVVVPAGKGGIIIIQKKVAD